MIDYLCASLAILVSAVLVLSCDRQTEAHDCYTHVTTVDMSKYLIELIGGVTFEVDNRLQINRCYRVRRMSI